MTTAIRPALACAACGLALIFAPLVKIVLIVGLVCFGVVAVSRL